MTTEQRGEFEINHISVSKHHLEIVSYDIYMMSTVTVLIE